MRERVPLLLLLRHIGGVDGIGSSMKGFDVINVVNRAQKLTLGGRERNLDAGGLQRFDVSVEQNVGGRNLGSHQKMRV